MIKQIKVKFDTDTGEIVLDTGECTVLEAIDVLETVIEFLESNKEEDNPRPEISD